MSSIPANRPLAPFGVLFVELSKDLNRAREASLAEGAGQFERRQLVRTFLAQVEGQLHMIRSGILDPRGDPHRKLGGPEVMLLRELAYDVDDKGFATTRSAKIPIGKLYKFTMNMLHKHYGLAYVFPVEDAGWDAMNKAVKLRDRLTHPRDARSLTVTDSEFQSLLVAIAWNSNQMSQVIVAGVESFKAAAAEVGLTPEQLTDLIMYLLPSKMEPPN